LVASASRDLDKLVEEQDVRQPLLEKFDFLVTHIAPLRKRKEDLNPLIEYFLGKHTPIPNRCFSTEVLDVFRGYDWPGNLYELERVIARLAVMSHEEVIGLQDVVAQAPKLAERCQQFNRAAVAVRQPSWDDGVHGKGGQRMSQVDLRVMRLARHLIKGEFADIKRFHPSLQKALEYVAENLHEAFTLQELARHACLSASHLSYLFQKTLGVSFKSFLAILRIEEAKQLLVEKPYMRITEISFEVGFGDLSHFERMFKRLVGQPPRDYRQVAVGAEEPENSPAS
jgi:AraC-like DNA-binding protein